MSLYVLNPVADLHWVGWDEEHVVFDATSGQTHLLDPVRAFILNSIGYDGVSFGDLLNDFSSVPGIAKDADIPALLNSVLRDFMTNGLVEVNIQ